MSARPAAALRDDGGTLLDRAAGWFVAPAQETVRAVPELLVPHDDVRAVVLGTEAEAPPVAAALAGALRAGRRAPGAIVAVWSPLSAPGGQPSRPAFPGARRLAARLSARGVVAAPHGRLAWVPVPGAGAEAAAALRRAGALGVPLVVAFAGPRSGELDGLIPEQDLIVVVAAEPEGPLARLALAGLADLAPTAAVCRPLYGGVRLLALAGLAGARALDEPLRAALQSLR